MDWLIWGPAIGFAVAVVLFTGPGLWSNHAGYPFLSRPIAWLKERWKSGK